MDKIWQREVFGSSSAGYFGRIALVIILCGWTGLIFAQRPEAFSNLRSRVVVAGQPRQALDSLTVAPPLVAVTDSATGQPLDLRIFSLHHNSLHIDTAQLRAACPDCRALRVRYRVWPYNLAARISRLDTTAIRRSNSSDAIEFDYSPYEPATKPWETGGLVSNGAYTRGISFGNSQNLVFNSNLNLQLNGKLGNDLELQAALSDNSIPLQPDGTTRQLQEFDRIFIQLKRKSTILTAGDYDLIRPSRGYFSNYFKRLQGAMLTMQYGGRQTADDRRQTEYGIKKKEEGGHNGGQIPHSAFAIPHSILHWHFRSEIDEKKVPGNPWLDNCIADQIKVLLERKTLTFNKKRIAVRPIRPGDIAVLCRSNRNCLSMAEALHRAGLQAAIARHALLETPEARLALACLKYLLTASDALSAAEIILLTGGMTLEQLVDDRLEWLAHKAGLAPLPAGGRWGDAPYLRQLNTLRPRTADLSASEILNLLLDELDLRRVVVRLGHPTQRLDNLDRLRHYALEYESACNRLHSAASLGGFLLWLDELVRHEKDAQGSGDSDDAVKVMTYHASKGLEFPVTICHALDQDLKEKVWGLCLVAETEEPDLDNILGHRWLRYWVNPYGDQLGKTRLEERLHQSEAWTQATRVGLEEEARLLYVGLTRARDYLVLPTTAKGSKWLNRVFNHGDETITTLDPHSDETPFYWKGEVICCENEPLYKPKDFPESLRDESPVLFHAPRLGRHPVPRQALLIDPAQDSFQYRSTELVAFAPKLEFKGEYVPALGKAINSFLIADQPALTPTERLAAAQKQLSIRQVEESLTAAALVRQGEAFRQFLQARFAPQEVLRKYPVELWRGQRLLKLEADFYLTSAGEITVLLLSGFAEGLKKWKLQEQHASLLGWWRLVLAQQAPDKTATFWVVLPVEGQAVQVLF